MVLRFVFGGEMSASALTALTDLWGLVSSHCSELKVEFRLDAGNSLVEREARAATVRTAVRSGNITFHSICSSLHLTIAESHLLIAAGAGVERSTR